MTAATMLYHAYQAQSDWLQPLRWLSRAAVPLLTEASFASAAAESAASTRKRLAADCQLFNLAEITHRRPDWDVAHTTVRGETQPVVESTTLTTPFATLRRFRRSAAADPGPRVLLVAPMSGHFATLLRDTVRTLVADHDVHVTDWGSARDVPLVAGRFGLTEYTQHLIRFIEQLGANGAPVHVVAICQPCVAALAAAALMAEDDSPATPASLTLMAGPIDCRIAPTGVNELATSKPIEWFEKNLISVVPWQHRGAGRRVYPGFVQLSAFMSMNRERHVNAFAEYHRLLQDDAPANLAKAATTRAFYEEYLAVADLPAEFYLETVREVFQTYALATGALRVGDRRVDCDALRRTALLTVEGERDDICSVGQTLAAQDLCTNVRPYLRAHYVQAGVGHYGVFSGRRWQQQIYPVLRDMIHHAG